MHFICLSEVNSKWEMMLDLGVKRINQTSYFENIRRIYCEPNISFCLNVAYVIILFNKLYRNILKTSFRYALDVFTKYGIKTLCYLVYINMSSQVFSKSMRNS